MKHPNMDAPEISLHIIGSKSMGGAERFFYRLISALNINGRSHKAMAITRRNSEVAQSAPQGVITYTSYMRTVWDPVSKLHLRKLIYSLEPHIVQTYMGRATRLTRLPKDRLPIHISRLGGYYTLDSYRHAHAWIGNTKGIYDYLISHDFPRKRVFFVPNFIDAVDRSLSEKKEELRMKVGFPLDALIVVSAGRFIPVKGHRYLLEAFSDLPPQSRGRPIFLVLLGDGPLKKEYMEFIQKKEIGGRVIMPGWVQNPLDYFIASDVVAFPSLEQETLGNVVLEAWAVRRPVVVSRFRGAREITRHGEDVLQVPCGDSKHLRDAIWRLLNDEDLSNALSAAGYEKVIGQYSRGQVVAAYEEVYATLLRDIMGQAWF